MERMTEWNDEQPRHAYYPRCFEEPCYGGGCKINDCPFETAVCDRLAAYEDTGLSPEKVSWMKEVVEAAFDNDTSIIEREHNLHVADKEGRVIVLPCKEGTTVYCISLPIATYPDKRKPEVVPIAFTRNDLLKFGTRVFLTREEAEKELAEMEGKKDG